MEYCWLARMTAVLILVILAHLIHFLLSKMESKVSELKDDVEMVAYVSLSATTVFSIKV